MSKSVWQTDCLAIAERSAGAKRTNQPEKQRQQSEVRVGWACQLVDILNGKLPRPSLQSATTGAKEVEIIRGM